MRDLYGREITYLRLSVTERCNLRCRYCMPEEGICRKQREEMLTEDEMILAVAAAASLGIWKLRITGGEPMVKRNLLSICRRTAEVPGIREVCMTTNATLLPGMIAEYKAAGLSRLNISLDTLDPQKYAWITRRGSLKEALAGIEAALNAGFRKIKLNAVLIGGFNDDEIPALAALTLRWPVDVRFIEMMPMPGNADFEERAYISYSRVLEALPELIPVIPGTDHIAMDAGAADAGKADVSDTARQTEPFQNAVSDAGVAKLYRLPGALGQVGLISPITDHFCGSCNRLRLTADGRIKPCLHSETEYSIKGLDREGMVQQFQAAILAKPAWHGELNCREQSHAARRMNQIGG